jgi:hypothetical protein
MGWQDDHDVDEQGDDKDNQRLPNITAVILRRRVVLFHVPDLDVQRPA